MFDSRWRRQVYVLLYLVTHWMNCLGELFWLWSNESLKLHVHHVGALEAWEKSNTTVLIVYISRGVPKSKEQSCVQTKIQIDTYRVNVFKMFVHYLRHALHWASNATHWNKSVLLFHLWIKRVMRCWDRSVGMVCICIIKVKGAVMSAKKDSNSYI